MGTNFLKVNVSKKNILFFAIGLIFVVLLSSITFTAQINNLLAIGVLVLSVLFVFKCRKNMMLLIMSIFISYCNYSVSVGIYLFPDSNTCPFYSQITDIRVYGIGIVLLFLFMYFIVLFMPNNFVDSSASFAKVFIRKENNDALLFAVITAGYIFILFSGYEIVGNARGITSPLYEYNNVLLILMFYYSGDYNFRKIISSFLAIVYSLTSFLNGTRIEAIICIIIVLLCLLKKKIPVPLIISSIIVGLVVFNIIGIFRGNYQTDSNMIQLAVDKLVENKMVFDTCTFAYFPMLCMVEMFLEYSFVDAMYFLFRFFLTIILGVVGIEDGNLIHYVLDSYFHAGGGFSLGFFYVWFSYLAPLIFAMIVCFIINSIVREKQSCRDSKLAVVLYLIATVPRWYLYGPWSLTRGLLICFIVFLLSNIIHKNLSNLKATKRLVE